MKSTTLPHLLILACATGAAGAGAGCAAQRAPDAQAPGNAANATASALASNLRLGDAVAPEHYQVELTLDPTQDTFAGAVTIDLALREATSRIRLNAVNIDVQRATFTAGDDTWEVPATKDGEDVIAFDLQRTAGPGAGTLAIEYRGRITDSDIRGVFRQQVGDDWYIYTQFEPLGARRAFPCFDEPHFKVPWQLTIHAPEGMMALSNTPEQTAENASPAQPAGADAKAGEPTRTHRFARTKPLPSYLVAFAVGPFETVDMGRVGRGRTPARIIVPRGRTGDARYAAAITGELLVLLEAYFDAPYPYAKLDSIAVPHFPGAMENAGLITYSADRILSSPALESEAFRRAYASTAAHELAHHWFGNQVTMAWWDDLWLNESFATWMSAKILAQWNPAWDSEIRQDARTAETMDADSLLSARRIRQPITAQHDIFSAFDAISYGKGSAVLGMFERWVGEERFRQGVRAYLNAHNWGTATAEDFLAAVASASAPEVPRALRTFLDQAGVPALSVELVCEQGEPPALALAQERYLPMGSEGSSTDRAWEIPVCVKYGANQTHEQCTLMREETAMLVLEKAGQCPGWVLANAGANGYYRVAYDRAMQGELLGPGWKHLSAVERVRLVDDIEALVTAGKMEMGEALALLPGLLEDGSEHVVRSAAELVAGVERHLLPAALVPAYARFVRETFGERARALGWQPGQDEDEATRALRLALQGLVALRAGEPALVEAAAGLARTWLDARSGVDAEVLDLVLATAVRHGDSALHARVEQAALATADPGQRRALIHALAQATEPARVRQNLALYQRGELDLREARALVLVPLDDPEVRDIAYAFIKEEYDSLAVQFPFMGRLVLEHVADAYCAQAHHDDVEAFFGPRAAGIPGGPRALSQALESIRLCAVSRAVQQPSVEAFFTRP